MSEVDEIKLMHLTCFLNVTKINPCQLIIMIDSLFRHI